MRVPDPKVVDADRETLAKALLHRMQRICGRVNAVTGIARGEFRIPAHVEAEVQKIGTQRACHALRISNPSRQDRDVIGAPDLRSTLPL